MKSISQREARRLRKRVSELESRIIQQRAAWSQEYLGGAQIGTQLFTVDNAIPSIVRTARKLRHAVVVVGDDSQTLRFIALPQASEDV